jgi:hypothetical protein
MNILSSSGFHLFPTASFRLMGRRYKGGGGGRPGGKPAFNWKEKKALNLTNVRKPVGMPLSGNFKMIEKYFDVNQGDFKITLSGNAPSVGNMTLDRLSQQLNMSSTKKVNINRLFGSNKPYGELKREVTKKPFTKNAKQ